MSTSANPHGTQHGEGSDYAEHFVRRRQRLGDVLYMIAALEFAITFFVANFAASFYYWVFLQANAWPALYVPCALVIASLIVLFSAGFRHYVKILSHRKRWYVTAGIGTAILAFSVFLSLLFLLKLAEIYSRGAFFFQLFAVTIALVGVRAITHNKLRASIAKNTIEARRVVLIGHIDHCTRFINKLAKAGLRIQATIPLPPVAAIGQNKSSEDDEIFRQIVRQCRPLRPDDILILATEHDLPKVELLAGALSELPSSLHMMPVALETVLATANFAELGLLPTIQLLQPPLSPFDRFIKRGFDLVVSTTGLVIFSPLFALVAIAIKLETPGPAIFRQPRHGFNNEVISVFKFRTMRRSRTAITSLKR